MPTSAAKRRSNQANAKKSTGPTSLSGKQKVRYNSVTHGGYCKAPVLPWEEPAGFDQRVLGFKRCVQPVGDVENALVEQAALASLQHERAVRSDVARVTFNLHTARTNERNLKAAEADELGRRLFFDRRGPLSLHPMPAGGDSDIRTSWSNNPDDSDHPARLVRSLESTQAGCRWLIAAWTKLYDRIKAGACWHSPQKLMAVRLLARQPIDLVDDPDVLAIYLCCHTIDPEHTHAFFEVQCELSEEEFHRFEQRLKARNVEAQGPADAVAARAALLGLVDRELERLNLLAADRMAFDDAMNALKTDIMGFDASTEGERLRRHAAGCERAMHRAFDTIIEMRKNLEMSDVDTIDSSCEGPDVTGDGQLARQDLVGDGHLARQSAGVTSHAQDSLSSDSGTKQERESTSTLDTPGVLADDQDDHGRKTTGKMPVSSDQTQSTGKMLIPLLDPTDSEAKLVECRSKATEVFDHPQVQSASNVEVPQTDTSFATNPEPPAGDHHEPTSGDARAAEERSALEPDNPPPGSADPKKPSERPQSDQWTPEIRTFTSLKRPPAPLELTIAANSLKARAQSRRKSGQPAGRKIPNERRTEPAVAPAPSASSSSSGWSGRRWAMADTRLVKRGPTPR
jgi:hypothetical protein